MGSIKHWARKTEGVRPKDEFEELRDAFYIRLQSEWVQFVSLSAALARAEDDPVSIFNDLGFRAHRLQGSAAIFEIAEVAAAANALEQAAVFASKSNADNTDPPVWNALLALVSLMGTFEPTH